jgi:non-heme chloroperoxidase
VLGGTRVSDQVWHNSFNVAAAGSAKATVDSVSACREDFRDDIERIDIPVLVLQGDEDRVLAKKATGDRLRGLIKDIRHVVIRGGPHAIAWTHHLEVNRAILDFIVTAQPPPLRPG